MRSGSRAIARSCAEQRRPSASASPARWQRIPDEAAIADQAGRPYGLGTGIGATAVLLSLMERPDPSCREAAHVRATDGLLLCLLSILWGGSFFFAAVAVQEIPPL